MNWKSKNVITGGICIFIIVLGIVFYHTFIKFDIKGTITKGLIGKQDIAMWYSGDSAETFTRATSTGYTMTLNKIDWPGVDVCYVFGGGVTKTSTIIAAAISAVGTTEKVELYLGRGAWPVTGTLSIPANITIHFAIGAYFSSTGTAAFAGSPDSQIRALSRQQIFSSTSTITFALPGTKYANWWQTNTTPGTTDMRVAIQAAIDAGDGVIQFLPETYLLTKGAAQTDEAGANYACLTMRSNMHIRGTVPAKLKLANNQSTDAASINIAMFLSIIPLSNISFDGIEIDMNGANNGVNGVARTFAPILFSGTTAGVAARGDYVTIRNCKFRNTPGVTVIGMAQSNTSGVTLGKYWTIEHCLFENNGLDTTDHSSIYAYAENILIKDNIFTQNAMYDNATGLGMRSAVEVHGANTEVSGNIIRNSWLGMYISTTFVTARDTANILIHDNIMEVARTGIYWSKEVSTAAERFIKINNNIIVLYDVAHGDTGPKSGLEITSAYPSTEIEIDNNTVRRSGGTTLTAALVRVGCPTAGQSVEKITISNNKGYDLTFGVYAYSNVGSIKDAKIVDNTWYNLIESSAQADPVGVYFENTGAVTSTSVIIKRNSTIDQGAVEATDYGVYIDGKITTLWLDDNENVGINTDIFLDTSEITNFYGTLPIVSTTYDPVSLNDGAGVTAAGVSVPGAAFGDIVEVIAPYDLQGIICTGYVQAANTVDFRLQNETTGVIDLASGTWQIRVRSPK